MMMNTLPSPDVLASLVSGVTETIFGMSFSVAASAVTEPWKDDDPWRTVFLPIAGVRPLVVAIAADKAGGQKLCGAMFSCPPTEVDVSMVEDSLRELVNIVAGQIKSVMGLDQALGLPRVLDQKVDRTLDGTSWQSATVRSKDAEVLVWVAITEKKI